MIFLSANHFANPTYVNGAPYLFVEKLLKVIDKRKEYYNCP